MTQHHSPTIKTPPSTPVTEGSLNMQQSSFPSSSSGRSAAEEVFGITELREAIMLQQDPADIFKQLTVRSSRETVKGSLALRQKLYLSQLPEIPVQSTPWAAEHQLSIWEPNRILCPEDGETYNFRIAGRPASEGWQIRSQYQWVETEDPAPYKGDFETFSNFLDTSMKPWYYYVLKRWIIHPDQPWGPTLTQDHMAMHLSDRATPIRMLISESGPYFRQLDEKYLVQQRHMKPFKGPYRMSSAIIWVPQGRRLGDVVRYFDAWKAELHCEAPTLNGICQFEHFRSDVWPDDEVRCRRRGLWVLNKAGQWLAPLPGKKGHFETKLAQR